MGFSNKHMYRVCLEVTGFQSTGTGGGGASALVACSRNCPWKYGRKPYRRKKEICGCRR